MKYDKFIELDRATDELYDKKRYEEALNLFQDGLKVLPKEEKENNYFTIMWNKAVLYTMCKKYQNCIEVIEETIDQGYAFPMHFDRFQQLKKKERYDEIKEKNDRLLEKIKKSTRREFVVHLPENYSSEKQYPLFIALHGDGICNIHEFSQYWKPDVFLENNFIFAYIQSSQVICHNGYGWLKDLKRANEDIKACYDLIVKEYSVDKSSILIGGFSGGAITSTNFTLSNIIPIKGFIGLCPEIKPEAFTMENVELAAKKGVKGVFMEGELVLPMKDEEEMLKMFDTAGLSYEYYINKGAGHNPPDDFDDKLRQALRFILA